MRAETIPFAGPAARWDSDDQDEFRRLAGPQFLRVDDDGNAIVRNADGSETTVYRGWFVTVPDGTGQAVFDAPDRVRVVEG